MSQGLLTRLIDIARHSRAGTLCVLVGAIALTTGVGITTHYAAHVQPSSLTWGTGLLLLMPLAVCTVVSCGFFVAGVRFSSASKSAMGVTPKCLYNYQTLVEPPIHVESHHNELVISRTRSYQILKYMFEHEDFSDFFAVDMAIRWWYELDDVSNSPLRTSPPGNSDDSVINESNRILEGITKQFHRPAGCKLFRRLFVVTREQLALEETRRVLAIIHAQEEEIRERRFSGRHIESRYVVWDDCGRARRYELGMLHDIACWTVADGEFALIDRQISRPLDGEHLRSIVDRTHLLCVNGEKLGELRSLFTRVFAQATPIHQPWRQS